MVPGVPEGVSEPSGMGSGVPEGMSEPSGMGSGVPEGMSEPFSGIKKYAYICTIDVLCIIV
jgi:hypothetical protein